MITFTKKYTLLFILVLVISFLIGCTKQENKRTVTGTITEVGTCGGNEGFFSGPYECKVAVKVGNTIEYWTVWGKMIRGQTVRRECYNDAEGKTWCGTGR